MQAQRRHRMLVQNRIKNSRGGGAGKRHNSGGHLGEHRSEGEQTGNRAAFGRTGGELRFFLCDLRQAEIEQLYLAAGSQKILEGLMSR